MCSSRLPYRYNYSLAVNVNDKVNLDFCWTNNISGDNIGKDSFRTSSQATVTICYADRYVHQFMLQHMM